MINAFNFQEDVEYIKIDSTHAHLWDQSAIAALHKVILNFRRHSVPQLFQQKGMADERERLRNMCHNLLSKYKSWVDNLVNIEGHNIR